VARARGRHERSLTGQPLVPGGEAVSDHRLLSLAAAGTGSSGGARGTVMMIVDGQLAAAAWAAIAAGPADRSSPVLGRVLLVAIVVVAAATFAVLQVLAPAGRPGRGSGSRRLARYDWRTLPPQDDRDRGDDPMPRSGQDEYGPLWRYGVPMGYGRVCDPGHRSGPPDPPSPPGTGRPS
jgi:hypothetical protein